MSDLSRDAPGTCDRFLFFQANKNSWILWVNNDDVQTTEHKSAVPLISFCKRNIFFSFLEGKRWWRRSHRWLTCYSFYADSVYIFNYTCIRFLFHYLFLVCSTNGMRWKKKFSGREIMQSKTLTSEYKTANTFSKGIFIINTLFSISVIKRVLEC